MDFDPTPWTNWLALFLALSATFTVIARYAVKQAKKRELARAKEAALRDEQLTQFILNVTKNIQTGTNGGYSLTDLHKKVDTLSDAVHVLRNEQERIATELAAYKDGQINRMEGTA
jgi:hypothetical protein